MLRFALKNMAIKKVQIILVVLSIVISAGVGVLAYNVSSQVSDGIASNAGYYSAIVGPSGSATQLAMNTMYFTDSPLGTIPYSVVSELQQDMRVTSVIPYAMADSFNGSPIVGTTPDFLAGREIAQGAMFDAEGEYEIVMGANVARINQVKVGDTVHTSHSASEVHSQPFRVVGILKESHTVYDNVVFTQLRTIWAVHAEEEEHEEEEHGEHEEEEEHHRHGEMQNMVCAILVRTVNPSYAMTLVNDYNGKIFLSADGSSYALQAIEPMNTVRGVLEEADNTKYIVFVLCAIIIVMNIMIIVIITLLNMYHSAREIQLMRLIGVSMKKINLLYLIQNALIGLASVILAFILSRVCLTAMGDYVANMGVVLDMGRIYPLEWAILGGIFLISVLPTVISTAVMSRQDGIQE